ncbi:hypothetical protein H6G27_18430 [Nostoc linckia FACHB-104]|nr:hypothetical protein [Nostoc linckia FACHB-104]
MKTNSHKTKINNNIKILVANSNLTKIASSLGIVYFLHKPFDFLDFLQTVNSAYEDLIRDS